MLQRILPIMLRSLGAFFTSVATLAAQSYSPMYNPQSTNAQSWVCIDQYGQRIPYAYFYFYTGTYLNTNAHFHDDPSHPWSSATCTTTSSYQCLSATDGYAGPDGVFSLQINTTLIGQAEVLVITCSSGGGSVSGASTSGTARCAATAPSTTSSRCTRPTSVSVRTKTSSC